jgi:hypothetical protein
MVIKTFIDEIEENEKLWFTGSTVFLATCSVRGTSSPTAPLWSFRSIAFLAPNVRSRTWFYELVGCDQQHIKLLGEVSPPTDVRCSCSVQVAPYGDPEGEVLDQS